MFLVCLYMQSRRSSEAMKKEAQGLGAAIEAIEVFDYGPWREPKLTLM